MVLAILAGTKTQTRRVMKLPKWADQSEQIEIDADGKPLCICQNTGCLAEISCPYGGPGSRLWVRESISKPFHLDVEARCFTGFYRASEPERKIQWIPSIHMPRWASRITLEVVSVRVERLQEISEADAMAEGVERLNCGDLGMEKWSSAFRNLWIDINGPGSWELNPFVWVVEFKRINP